MNVLIVDDQKEVAEGLADGLDWGGMGIESVACAYSAWEARSAFLCGRIDILLCDIEMPQENGLSLFRWVTENYPETECIFLTSHAEFDYAREALSLGSFDYILQPARYEEVENAIRRAQLKLHRKDRNLKLDRVSSYREEAENGVANNYLQEIIHYGVDAQRNMDKILELKLKRKYKERRICPVLLQIVRWRREFGKWENVLLYRSIENIFREIFEDYGAEAVLLEYGRHTYLALICAEAEAFKAAGEELCYMGLVRYQQFEEQYMDFISALYQGNVVCCEEFREEFDGLRELMKQNILRRENIFHGQQQPAEQSWDKMNLFHIERWGGFLMEGQGTKIRKEISAYFDRSDSGFYEDSVVLKKLHCAFTAALVETMRSRNISYAQMFGPEYSLEDYMKAFDTYAHFTAGIDHVLAILEKTEEERRPEGDSVEEAVRYIKDHVEKKLTRESIAGCVHLNEDYLSRIFKEKTGYTVKEYILIEKMNLAKELLASTNLSIGIIALKTGFENFSHFSRVFKKQEGISPNEYREKCRKQNNSGRR